MNKKMFPLIFLLLSFKCVDYCELSNKILFSYSKELKKQKQMTLIGHGGAMMYDLEEVSMHFFTQDRPSLEQARELYVEVSEEYLRRYNADESIRKYLHNYPFAIKNLDLKIAFVDKNGKEQEGDCVSYTSRSKKDEIYYYKYKNGEYVTLHKEPYSRAVEIVRGQK